MYKHGEIMTKQITIYTDYVCPYCLLAEYVIQSALHDKDFYIQWRPFELRPDPVPALRIEDPYLPNVWEKSVYPMAKRLGVPIKLPAISPQPRTDKAFEVFAMADERGLGHLFSIRALKAFFQEEKDIGDLKVLADLGADVGLQREAVLSALITGKYTEHHRAALRNAREDMNVTSVPTIIIGNQVFRGMPSFDALRQAIDDADQESSWQAHVSEGKPCHSKPNNSNHSHNI
jgi:predicted DsbA family dithiol-disulfide isomerase